MLQKLLNKLIRNSASQTKYLMALIGLSVAILLILSAVQLQSNYYELLNGKNNQDSIANFLVVNKILTNDNVGASSLSEASIDSLKKQTFIESVGTLTGSRFKASIESNSSIFPFYTDISFESVPESFIDVTIKDWKWNEQSNFIPIIVPNQFLDFYNFQYSFSQNLPQLTPDLVKMVLFKVRIHDSIQQMSFNGKVVGFSNRISSMLVPQEFMDWGNQKFGAKNSIQQASRVVIKTKDAGNPALSNYLKKEGLQTDADKTRFSKYRQVVDFVVRISGITGLLMLSFALLIFSLFIQLTIASCKDEIALLILLGNSPKNLGKFLMKRFLPANIWIIAMGLILVTICQYFIYHLLLTKQIYLSKWISPYCILAAIVLIAVIAGVNYLTIQRYLRPKSVSK